LTTVKGQFAVDENGDLKNPSYTVVYTPEVQEQTVNITFPASAHEDNLTGKVVNTSVTGKDFTDTDLTEYNVDGYTMYVDGKPATMIAAEATDTTANGLSKTDSKPQDHTVTFVANDVTGEVVIIDDVTGKQVQAPVDLTGKTDADVVYNSAATIKQYTDKGYVLVSNDLSDAKTFNADDSKNHFEIHLNHGTTDGKGEPTTVKRQTTIKTPDGKTTTVEQVVEVTPHYSVDKVTGKRVPNDDLNDKTKYDNTETPWFDKKDKTSDGTVGVTGFDKNTGTPTFGDVKVPNIPGYTVVRTPDDSSKPNGNQTVTYKANDAKAQVVYVDDATGKTLQTDHIDGVTDAKIDYNSDDVIKDYVSKGYVLVSDGFM
jgi:hypothetical protein